MLTPFLGWHLFNKAVCSKTRCISLSPKVCSHRIKRVLTHRVSFTVSCRPSDLGVLLNHLLTNLITSRVVLGALRCSFLLFMKPELQQPHQPCCKHLSQVFSPVPTNISFPPLLRVMHWSGPFISFFKKITINPPPWWAPLCSWCIAGCAHLLIPLSCASPCCLQGPPGHIWRSLAGFWPSSPWVRMVMVMQSVRKCFIWLGVRAGIYHLFSFRPFLCALTSNTVDIFTPLLFCLILL